MPYNNNLNPKKQAIFLMITDGKKWHYLGVKKFPALLRGVTFPVTQIVQKKNLKSIMRYVKIMIIIS